MFRCGDVDVWRCGCGDVDVEMWMLTRGDE